MPKTWKIILCKFSGQMTVDSRQHQYTIDIVGDITGGTVVARGDQSFLDHLLLDSRKIILPSSSIFFALKGPRRDGHQFISEVYQRGVRNFVVSEEIDPLSTPGSNLLKVEDTLTALQLLAIYHRLQFNIPVIGITGSNGKTIVKEWLNQLLESRFRIVRSPKSYNSQTGVPLSIWMIGQQHQLGIFEAGISMPGEMENLERMIRPTIGVFTALGEAHSEGFKNIEEKISEKLLLFKNASAIVYCKDIAALEEQVKVLASGRKKAGEPVELASWSRKGEAPLQVKKVHIEDNEAKLEAVFEGRNTSISIPFADEASIENAITCWCVLLHLGCDDAYIAEEMKKLSPVAMRLELRQGINNCSIINDSYSADLSSLNIALDFLLQQQQHATRTVVLSDILQSGRSAHELYSAVARALLEKKVNRLYAIGPSISEHKSAFEGLGLKTFFFNSVAEFLHDFHSNRFQNETILLKGARIFEFESINALLEQQVHQTVLEIDLSAIAQNLKSYQQLLNPGKRIMAMVKAFSYGSGSYEIANLLQFHKVDYLTVAYADEGVELRKAGISLPIMVMNPEEASFGAITDHDLEPEIFSINIFQSFQSYLRRQGVQDYPIHLKLDTGMHRLGFQPAELDQLLMVLRSSGEMRVKSVFSHLVASEDHLSDAFTKEQGLVFSEACVKIESSLGYPFLKHIANTAAIARHPELQFDMVRLGIGLYGVSPGGGANPSLREASKLKTTIAQIKDVKAGESVGYGRKAILRKDSRIATIRLGYADGYPRSVGNGKGYVSIKGKPAPVVGNVCMDMTMVDISDIDDVNEGDLVLVFGPGLSISEVAKWADTIPYEIMTGISRRVRRVYFEES